MMRLLNQEVFMNSSSIATKIANIEQQIQIVQMKQKNKQDVAPEITRLISELRSCHASLQPGQVTPADPQSNEKLKTILKALNLIINDKSIQEKVAGLVASLRQEANTLELKLTDKDFKLGHKVAKSHQSKST